MDGARPKEAEAGGLVGRLAGGVLVLVVLGTAVVGLVLGTRTARLYAGFEAQIAQTTRAELAARLRATAQELGQRIQTADEADDWSLLQAGLPARAAADADLLALFVTDAEGLVLADADPSHNGHPLSDERLRPLLRKADGAIAETSLGGKPMLVTVARTGTSEGAPRVAWVGGDLTRAQSAQQQVVADGKSALRFGWVLVGLGGLIIGVIGVGVVVLVGGSVTRRLQTVSWRIGQLGRGDRSTHMTLDGPAELRQVGSELDLAARRIAVAETVQRRDAVVVAAGQARTALITSASALPARVGGLDAQRVVAADARAVAIGHVERPAGALLWMIEVVGDELDDVLVAAELKAAAGTLARADAGLAPSKLVAGLDREIAKGKKARAIAIAVAADGRLTLCGAAGRWPIVRRADGTLAPVVLRGDRLGEADPVRGAEASIELAPGDAIYLCSEPAPASPAAREGQVPSARALAAGPDTLLELTRGVVLSLARPA